MGERAPLVVVGDALLDLDARGAADRLCPDAPAPVVAVDAEAARPGGAALAAALAAAADERPVRFVTALAGASGARLRPLLDGAGVELVDLGRARPTPVKQRILAGDRCVLRIDRHDAPAPPLHPGRVAAALRGAGAVLASDYGRGVLSDATVRGALARHAAALVWDPHPRGGLPVAGTALATPNHREAIAATGIDGPPEALATAVGAATALVARWDVRAVAVTRGAAGAVLVDRSGAPRAVPAPTATGAADTCGAGDAFAATAALALAAGAFPSEAVARAVEAATAFVVTGGAARWTRPGPSGPSSGRQPPGDGAGPVVATSGCFDLIHAGHVAFLEGARRLGSRLVVLLNSDASVRALKGPGRPLQAQADREAVLRSLAAVDDVLVFDDATPVVALEQLRPDTFVKGGDYTAADLPEATAMARWGGTTVTLPYLPGRSTTRLIQEVRRHVDAR